MNRLYIRAIRSTILGACVLGVMIFVSAGTVHYWQGWVFFAEFVVASSSVGLYFAIRDPIVLERRLSVGPTAEKEVSQKIITILLLPGFIALIVVPAFERRLGWAPLPGYVSILGDILVLLGLFIAFLVVRQNSFAASTIQVVEDQKVISTGLYAFVRHPMYAGTLPMLVGIPLALGSWLGLLGLVVIIPALMWRAVDEERFLRNNLPGYTAYTHTVKYRLIPLIW